MYHQQHEELSYVRSEMKEKSTCIVSLKSTSSRFNKVFPELCGLLACFVGCKIIVDFSEPFFWTLESRPACIHTIAMSAKCKWVYKRSFDVDLHEDQRLRWWSFSKISVVLPTHNIAQNKKFISDGSLSGTTRKSVHPVSELVTEWLMKARYKCAGVDLYQIYFRQQLVYKGSFLHRVDKTPAVFRRTVGRKCHFEIYRMNSWLSCRVC